MPKREAIKLIFWASENGANGSTVLKKMKAAKIGDVVKCFLKILHTGQNYPVNIVGTRVGEKQHESLISEDEALRTREEGDYFIIEPYAKYEILKNLIKEKRTSELSIERLSSANEKNQLDESELEKYIREYIEKEKGTIQYI
jgi:UDP-glucose 4-epimerase